MSESTTSTLPSGDELRDAAGGVQTHTVELRRAIHEDPELGLQLPTTQAKIPQKTVAPFDTSRKCASVPSGRTHRR